MDKLPDRVTRSMKQIILTIPLPVDCDPEKMALEIQEQLRSSHGFGSHFVLGDTYYVKCRCGGVACDWHSHASDCTAITEM